MSLKADIKEITNYYIQRVLFFTKLHFMKSMLG